MMRATKTFSVHCTARVMTRHAAVCARRATMPPPPGSSDQHDSTNEEQQHDGLENAATDGGNACTAALLPACLPAAAAALGRCVHRRARMRGGMPWPPLRRRAARGARARCAQAPTHACV
jgi:hypothetical protein